MRADATFTVESFTPAALEPVPPEVTTALPLGVATIEKRFSGEVTGRSVTIFVAAFDQARGVGSYVAMESFEGALGGASGSFDFIHSASTSGADRSDEHPHRPVQRNGSLEAISGSGRLSIDADGTHRVWFDYSL